VTLTRLGGFFSVVSGVALLSAAWNPQRAGLFLLALALVLSKNVLVLSYGLTQTACQFLEAEHYIDRDFVAGSKEACDAINHATWPERAPHARPLLAVHGDFIIRVTNVDVPHEVDFWLRPYDMHWTHKQGAPAGLREYRLEGIAPGETKEVRVHLPRSFYRWSSPQNSTPDYSLLIYDPNPQYHW
jgi:hypothetical protein